MTPHPKLFTNLIKSYIKNQVSISSQETRENAK